MLLELLISLLCGIAILVLLSVKWCLPFKKTIIILLFSVVLSIVSVILIEFIIPFNYLLKIIQPFIFVILYYVIIILYLFFRDPERIVPEDNNIIVSPADGQVIYINTTDANLIVADKKESKIFIDEIKNEIDINRKLIHIGIAMVFTDVHINRAPVSGEIKFLKHKDGKFLSLRNNKALNENERQTIILRNGSFDIIIVQIASRLVRRIVSYVNVGQEIKIGSRIGVIKFGSQVDILLPEEKITELNIKPDDYLVAGETIIAKY